MTTVRPFSICNDQVFLLLTIASKDTDEAKGKRQRMIIAKFPPPVPLHSTLRTPHSAPHSRLHGIEAGNSSLNTTNIMRSNLLCTHCNKRGHVESTCCIKYPHLKDKPKASITGETKVSFHTTAETTKTARKVHIGANGEGGNPDHWILGSGASEHFTPHKHILIDYKSLDEPVEVNTAKGKLHGIGTGSVHITVEGQDCALVQATLEEVLYIPGMDFNLLSSNVLLGKGLEINMHPTKGTNILLGDMVVAKTFPHGKLLCLKTVEEHAFKTVGRKPTKPVQPKPLPYDTWHHRFAHLGP